MQLNTSLTERNYTAKIWFLTLLFGFSIASPALGRTSQAGEPARRQNSCETPLIAAIRQQEIAVALKIIDSGADLNARACSQREGATALIEATQFNEIPVIARLLVRGADPNETAGRNESPLQTAAFYCKEEVAVMLLSHGAIVNASDLDGDTALMASSQNCPDGSLSALLIRSGAEIDHRAKDGSTALTTASFYGNEDTVHVLVAAGADLTAENGERETALVIARDREVGRKPSHDRIYQFLSRVGALKPPPRT